MIGLGIGLFSNIAALASAAPALSPYTGQVATRSAIPDTTLAQTKILSRTVHYSTEALTSIKVKFPAWYTSGTAELTAGSNVTVTASIEYPAGTFTQVKWAASASVVATNGADTGLSDAITVSIPANTPFWVRSYATTTASGLPCCTDNFWSGNDAAVIDGTATDLTMSGTVTNTSAGKALYPECIVQTTTRPSFLLLGDSRTIQAGVDSFGNKGQAATSLTTAYGYINTGKSGALLRDFNNGGGNLRAALQAYCSHVIHGFGINDIAPTIGNTTAAKLESDFIAAAYAFPGKNNIICTLSPYTTSTDSWATVGNQTANANDAARLTFNTWARTVPDPFYACVDIASTTESGGSASPSGKWVAGFTSDGLHPNSTADAATVSGGVLNPATLGASAGISRFSPVEYTFEWINANDAAASGSTPVNSVWGGGAFAAISTVTYGASSFNSGPGYTIASGAALDVTNSTLPQNASTIFVGLLATWPTTPGSNTAVAGYTTTGSNSIPRAMIMINTSGQPGLAIRRLDADTTVTAYGSSALTAGTAYLFTAQFDPANGTAKLYVNGALQCTASYGTTGATSNTTAGFSILNFLSSGGPGYVMGEYIGLRAPATTSAANDAIRQKLEGDMAWRRGAAATFLPGGHPYLSARPPV